MNYIDTNKIPEMLSVRETAKRFHLSEYCVRQLVHNGQIIYIQPGGPHAPIYVNADRLIEFLSGGDGNV